MKNRKKSSLIGIERFSYLTRTDRRVGRSVEEERRAREREEQPGEPQRADMIRERHSPPPQH